MRQEDGILVQAAIHHVHMTMFSEAACLRNPAFCPAPAYAAAAISSGAAAARLGRAGERATQARRSAVPTALNSPPLGIGLAEWSVIHLCATVIARFKALNSSPVGGISRACGP